MMRQCAHYCPQRPWLKSRSVSPGCSAAISRCEEDLVVFRPGPECPYHRIAELEATLSIITDVFTVNHHTDAGLHSLCTICTISERVRQIAREALEGCE